MLNYCKELILYRAENILFYVYIKFILKLMVDNLTSIDQTDEKIYLIFDKILRAYDIGLIFYETKDKFSNTL